MRRARSARSAPRCWSPSWRAERLTATRRPARPAPRHRAGLVHHPVADLVDQAALLGHRDELGRRDRARGSGGASAQRLAAGHPARPQVDDRLVVQLELPAVRERAGAARLEPPLRRMRVHRAASKNRRCAAGRLGARRAPGRPAAAGRRDRCRRGARRDADARRRSTPLARRCRRARPEPPQTSFGASSLALACAAPVQHDRELVAAEPRHDAAGRAARSRSRSATCDAAARRRRGARASR